MEATATLPRFCIIKSNYNNRYLQIHTTSDVPDIALQFSEGNMFDLLARFEMVPATTGGGLYHIRSMHSNKFLAHLGEDHMWITAIASEPQEDQHSKTCTLFKAILVNPGGHDNKTIRLRHVNTGNFACLSRVGPPFNECLYTAVPTADRSECDVFTIINWEEIFLVLVTEITALKVSLTLERAERKALAERLAVLEVDVARLKFSEIKLTEGGSTSKCPWMNDATLSYCNAIPFKDLEVHEEFASDSTRITIIDTPRIFREDDTTNIRANHFKRGMLDGQVVCWVVNVAALPNNEMARFDPAIWGLLNKSGTSYAVSRATKYDTTI